MTDLEKYIAEGQRAFCIEEVATKTTYYNCFGDKIDEDTKITSTVFVFDKSKAGWVKGIKENKE